jgi:hypothetical protein
MEKMKFISKVKKELKRTNFVNNAFVFLEENYICKEFHGAAKYGESINEFYSIEEKSQIGVQLSAKIFSAFYSFLKYEANIFFERNESFLRVVTERNIHENESYDLILKDITTNEIEKFEIKLSQNQNSWQGSTSSTNKVKYYLLFNFEIDRDLKLNDGNNKGFFKSVFTCLVNLSNQTWSGEAKNNSHRTKFDFRISNWSIDFLRKECIILGDMVASKSIYHLVKSGLNYE